MFKTSFIAALIYFSLVTAVTSKGLDVAEMPEEFRKYFFDSPIPVRVFLNDEYAFDGTFVLNEMGEVRLKSVLSSADGFAAPVDQASKWESLLQKGITLGECSKKCPEGLVATDYVIERSELKIYTRQYEHDRNTSNYINLPTNLPVGLIVNNDFTASGYSGFEDWRLNSSWLSSFLGWTQKVMLQSAYSNTLEGYRKTELNEAWTQKEFEGTYFRAGVFSPDSESGNVQMPGYSSDRIAGAMLGTSDTLLISGDNVSLYPVYVTGRNQSVADVFINDRLVYTQQLQAGIQALDTRRLPSGIYDITIRISENGSVSDVQTAQVYKPTRWGNADKRWRGSLWAGQAHQAELYTGEPNSNTYGFKADFLLHPRSTVGISFAKNAREQIWSVKNETQLTDKMTIYTRYNLWQDGRRDSDMRLFRSLGTGSVSAGWRHGVVARNSGLRNSGYRRTSDIYSGSLTWQFANQYNLTASGQYASNGYRDGLSTSLALRKTLKAWDRSNELRLSVFQRPAWATGRKDTGLEIGISIPVFSKSRMHSASAELGSKNNEGYANLSYNWHPEESSKFSHLSASTSLNRSSNTVGINGGIKSSYASGDFYTQKASGGSGVYSGVNLSNTIALGGGEIAFAGDLRDASAAVIVDVDSSLSEPGLTVASSAGDVSLKNGRNLVSAELWERRNMQFDGNNTQNMHVYPPGYSYQMNEGSVGYVSVKAVRKKTIIALIKDENDRPILNRETKSDIAQAHVNSDGVVTIDVSVDAKNIIVTEDSKNFAMSCWLPNLTNENRDTVFIDSLICKK